MRVWRTADRPRKMSELSTMAWCNSRQSSSALLLLVSLNVFFHKASLAGSVIRLPQLTFGGSANVTATAGQTAKLPCNIQDLGDRAVSWIRKRDLHILTTDIFTYTSDARYQVGHPEGSQNWTLLVKYAQARDTGVYECQVNTEPKRSLAFFLRVVEAFATIQGPRQVYAKVDSTLRLTCVVNMPTSGSEVALAWLQGGKALAADRWVTETSQEYVTSRLTISGARDRDSGTYTCAPADAAHAQVQVHVISGEHPAAMQHGSATVQYATIHHVIASVCFAVIVRGR